MEKTYELYNGVTSYVHFLSNLLGDNIADPKKITEKDNITLSKLALIQNFFLLSKREVLNRKGNLSYTSKVIDEYKQLSDEIGTLNEEAANTTDSIEKNKLLAEASAKSKKLQELQSKRIKFGNRQRSLLLKKSKKESLKRRMIAKQEVSVAKSEIKARKIDEKQMNLKENFVNDLIVDNVLEVRRRSNE